MTLTIFYQGSGKTRWISAFLRERQKLISPCPPHRVLFYAAHQPIYDEWLRNKTITKMIQVKDDVSVDEVQSMCAEYKKDGGSVLVFDDGLALINSMAMQYFFTVMSHHYMASIILVSQTLFGESNRFRVISTNSQYYTIMKSPRNMLQISTFGQQLFPYRSQYFVDSFKRSTRLPYGYLCISVRQETPDALRLFTNIFDHQRPPLIFLENSNT